MFLLEWKSFHERNTDFGWVFSLDKISVRLLKMMMLFRSELGWSVLELLGRSVVSERWAPLQTQETKRIGGGSPVASLMPNLVLSDGREDQLLRE